MANLVFFEENHRYTVDGEEVPSVSELTRFIAREIYGEIQQTVLDTAAARGTKVHKAAEALDKFGSVEIDDDLSGYERTKQGCREDICQRCGWNAEEHKRRLDKLQGGKGLVKCQDGLKRLKIPDRHILLD